MRNYLTFDNKDSRDFGVYINGQGTFRAPARSYNVLNIPGRNGDLLGFGSKLENVEITYRAFIYTNFDANIAALRSFLLSRVGYFKLTDSYHPDEYRLAYYKGPFVPDVVANNGAGGFDLTFVCKPQRFLNSGEEVTTLTPAGTEQHTYQGEIVHFSTLAGDKITSALADFHPIQDLHGYANPWPGGAGINKLSPAAAFTHTDNGITLKSYGDGRYTLSGTATASFEYLFDIPEITMPGTVYIHLLNSAGGSANGSINIDFYNGSTRVDFLGFGTTANRKYNGTSALGGKVINKLKIRVLNGEAISGELSFSPMALLANDTVAFSPYANICPISGRTGLSVYRTGKNLLSYTPTWLNYSALNVVLDKTRATFLKGNTQYMFSFDMENATSWRVAAVVFDENGNRLFNSNIYYLGSSLNPNGSGQYYVWGSNKSDKQTAITPIQDCYVMLFFNLGNVSASTVMTNPMLELGPTATTYEPYNGNTYAVDWTSQAGTVYHGTVDPVAGQLTVTRGFITLVGGNEATYSNNGHTNNSTRCLVTISGKANGVDNMISNQFVYNNSGDSYGIMLGRAANNKVEFYLPPSVSTNVEDQKAWFSDNPTEVCFELATPITYQLTPQEIEALTDNYMWSDVGQVTVTVTDAMTIENPTLFDAKPLLRVYGAGTLTLGGQTITISTADVYTDIDCEMMDCFKDTVSKNGNVSFSGYDFPVIPPGRNVITMDGVTQVDITPRWWAA